MVTGTLRQSVAQHRWVAAGFVVLLIASAAVAFGIGRHFRINTEDVKCLSAPGTIGCTLKDGWDVSVPLDVAWTDSQGTFHEGGRPECLPPTGRGLEGPVRLSWTKVDIDGMGWRQVVWVGC